jgi:HK97 family phage major capsid protein
MSKKIIDLRARRDAKAKEVAEISAKYAADVRMPEGDAKKIDDLLDEVANIDTEITREQRVVGLGEDVTPEQERELALAAGISAGRGNGQSDESRAMRAFMSGGVTNLLPEDSHRMRNRQTPDIRNAMSTTTPAEGGFTTAPEWQRNLEEAMKSYSGLRQLAFVMRTATGTTINFPTTDATAEEGEIVGQNTLTNTLDTAFGNTTIDVYKYSSKSIALPFELIQDSFIDIEAYINRLLGIRLGRITGKHYQIGTGTGQPRGLNVAAPVGATGTTGQTLSVTYDDLVKLEHSVDPAYRNGASVGYAMHDQSLGVVRRIKDSQGRPIFVPGYETGSPGAPDRLLNRPITVDQFVPVMAANAKSIEFGDFSKYTIRDVMDLTLFRMTDSAYTLKGQVGFVGFMRSGGNLVDAGGAIKCYQNSST